MGVLFLGKMHEGQFKKINVVDQPIIPHIKLFIASKNIYLNCQLVKSSFEQISCDESVRRF